MHLANLTDEELVRHADLELNDLTSTDLERELLGRLQRFIGQEAGVARAMSKMAEYEYDDAEAAALLERAAEHELDADDLHKLGEAITVDASHAADLLKKLTEFDIADAADLHDALLRYRDFQEVAEELAEPFARLAALINPTPTTAPKEQVACTPSPSH